MNLEKNIIHSIESKIDEYMYLVKQMYDHPELGNEEYQSMALLCDYLEKVGFHTTRNYIVPTGFIGKYSSVMKGPTIAFICEYDALPEVGHGCGHNLIAGISIAAGEAIKEVIDQVGGSVVVIGTPAEENFGGKVEMVKAGVFDDVDVALMVHPGTYHGIGAKASAIYPVKFEFYGKNAHGCYPQEGISALDAVVTTYIQINMLRQFVEPGTFIHGIISDGGKAANVIPGYASLEYYFRAPTMKYAKEVANMAIQCATGIADATRTSLKTSIYECPYDDILINYTLADILKQQYQKLGLKEIHSVHETPAGSTDLGAVSYVCPTLQGNIKIADTCVAGHSKEMANATISVEGKNGLLNASKAIALVALELYTSKELLDQVKDEFKNRNY